MPLKISILFFEMLLFSTLISGSKFHLQYHWRLINFTWPSSEVYEKAINDGSYIKEHNIVNDIKLWKNNLYLAIPRLKNGVPATLASVPIDSKSLAPFLKPFPNWSMQQIGDCSTLQSVHNMEIDPKGRMWIINKGVIKNSKILCPTRLMILDIEKNGKILLDYTFREFDSLSDIILDNEDGGFAYIIDNDIKHPGIVIFSLQDMRSWKVHHKSMKVNPEVSKVIVKGSNLLFRSKIALSPASTKRKNRWLYYSAPLSSEIFALPTFFLKSGGTSNIDRYVRSLGRKLSLCNGMTMSALGKLYFSLPMTNAVGIWNTKNLPLNTNQKILLQNPVYLDWPESMAINYEGQLWIVVKRRSSVINNRADKNDMNFHIIRIDIKSRNYQYYEDGSVPLQPEIINLSLIAKLARNLRLAVNHLRRRALMLS